MLDDTGGPIVIFDNVTGGVRSPVLAGLLTSTSHSDRRLGSNRTVRSHNDRLWGGDRNNAQLGGDLARRSVVIEIDPDVPDPYRRTGFALRPREWMREHRGDYLAALLTVARAWQRAGSPHRLTHSDSYDRWAASLTGMLEWADLEWNGEPARFGADAEAGRLSVDDEEWATFLAALHAAFGDAPFTTRRIVAALSKDGTDRSGDIDGALLPEDLSKDWARVREPSNSDDWFRKRLGRALKNGTGRYAGGWKLVDVGQDRRQKVRRYRVQPPPSTDS